MSTPVVHQMDGRGDITHCDACGEEFTDAPSGAVAEVVDTRTNKHLLVHAEPCSFENPDYVMA